MYQDDFPIFKNNILGQIPFTYLDNAATSQKPQVMIDKLKYYYEHDNANIHRGIYKIAEKSTLEFESTREKIANMCNRIFEDKISKENVIFTRNTTESINLAANSFVQQTLDENSEILTSELDHHSNILPWIKIADEKKAKIVWIPMKENLALDLGWCENYLKTHNKIVKMVAFTGASNITGELVDFSIISKLTTDLNIPLLIDGAQWLPHAIFAENKYHLPDFFPFSSHKICGPNGVGVLIVKDKYRNYEPFLVGGSTIESVKKEKVIFKNSFEIFEAGTQDIAGVIALGTSLDYLLSREMKSTHSHLIELNKYCFGKLSNIPNLKIFSPKRIFENEIQKSVPIFSFLYDNIHPHDLAQILDESNVCVRAGMHCGGIFHEKIGHNATTRASLYFYNTRADIDRLINGILNSKKLFN